MAKCLQKSHRDKPEQLTLITSAYNASVHDVTQYSPNLLTYARELTMPVDLVYGTPASARYDGPSDYVNDLRDRLEEAYAAVRRHCGTAAERRGNKYYRSVRDPTFEVGERVWHYLPRRRQSRYYKWESLYLGPFRIVAKRGRPTSGSDRQTVGAPIRWFTRISSRAFVLGESRWCKTFHPTTRPRSWSAPIPTSTAYPPPTTADREGKGNNRPDSGNP